MKGVRKLKFIIFALLLIGAYSCKKQDIQPNNYIDVEINKKNKEFTTSRASMGKGMTILLGNNSDNNEINTLIITIHGIHKGTYKQDYDYKTNVSVTQCALTYKTISKSETDTPQFYSSYEGKVKISEIDRKNKKISGSYSFSVNAIPNNNNAQIISGEFINVSIK